MEDLHPLLKRFTEKGVDVDDIAELGNIFFLQGKEHSTPSPETARRLRAIEMRLETTDRFHEEQREFMKNMNKLAEDVKPIIDAMNGATILGTLLKWLAGSILAAGAIWAGFVWIIRQAT